MNRFRTGLIAGSILGMVGISMAMSDRKTRKMLVKDGRIMKRKAGRLMDKLDIM